MANKREYEMLFALNARMNGGFSGTFSKAQAEFSRLGKEIQGLHRVQGDIASYRKQQQAMDATRGKLENLQKQHDLLQKEIGETSGSTVSLEREKAKLEQRIKDTETALERQGQKLSATGERLKEAGVDTGNLARKDAELTAKIKELEAAQDNAANSAVSFGEQSAQAFEAAGQALAAAGVAVALRELAGAWLDCVGLAGDFEASMSNVAALSQANAREMAALSAQAKELGATTKFTALEAGDAMGYMAMAGWDAADMLQGMDGVLQLAAASGEDLAMVSDIVTDSLSAFGLTARDTAHFSDVLAAAATNANTNVAIMGETFKMSASVAGALGYRVEDVALAMGLMANSGVKGSIAGTALRNTFNGLLEGATLTAAAFGTYQYSAVRADGTMKDFASTMEELRGLFDQMTEAERVNNAMVIAGQRGYNGLLAILNATDADYTSLSNSINNCAGAAQRMANIKLDNLNGQLTLMNSAWDALRTTIGEQFNPELRALAELGTDVLGWIDGFVREHPALVKGVMSFTGAMGAAAVAVTGVSAALKLLKALDMATLFTGPVGGILAGAAAVAGLTAAVIGLLGAAQDGETSLRELTEAARDMDRVMDEAGEAYERSSAQTLAAAEAAGMYIDKLEELEAAQGENARESQEYQNALALLLRTMPELSDSISQTTDEYGRTTYALETSTAALEANAAAWKKNAQAKAYQDYLNKLYEQYGTVMLEAAENSVKLTQAQTKLDDVTRKRNAAQELMNKLDLEAYRNGTALPEKYFELQRAVLEYNVQINALEPEIEKLNQALADDEAAVAGAEAEIESAQQAIEGYTGATEEQTQAQREAAAQTLELRDLMAGTAERVLELGEAYEDAYTAALSSVGGQYALWQQAAEVAEVSADSINRALESQVSYWQDYNANLQTLMSHAGEIEGLSAMVSSFADGSQESVNAVAGMAAAFDRGDVEAIRKMVATWQELQKEQRTTADSLAELKTDFSNAMDELQTEVAADIAAMDLGDDAAQSGRATIQGYIDGAYELLPAVRRRYAELGRAAISALGGPAPSYSDSAWYANRGAGYASGTSNAPPGWAWVGEDGPELMRFRGGEQVLNAAQSSAVQHRAAPAVSAGLGVFSPSVQVAFHIGGNAAPETVQALRDYGDDFAQRVLEVLEDAGVDARRGAY